MTAARRDPDELLRRVADEERRSKRGKLVIFFGAAPGVGKTYAMLEAARSERDLRRDVVAGIVETHGRYDTASLVIGLDLLPRRKIVHRGVELEELDLDAALARRPGLLLVDELAHTNAPGSRHAKRWQDVEELLDAGIDVYTTLNVQHVESLNDVVAQVTGVVVRETVPDRMLEEATEIRLIDLPPDELLERLAAGQVYVPEQARRALESFFRKGNLIALRELALRRTAERVDEQMRTYRTEHGIQRVWPTGERVLVCVSSSPLSPRLIRAARRMAGSLHAQWSAVNVQTRAALRMTDGDRARLAENMRLAEQLGAETVTLEGDGAAEETVRWARAHNVTKIVLGKPTHPRWRDLLRSSFLEDIVRGSGDIDVYVITGEDAAPRPVSVAAHPKRPPSAIAYVSAASAVAIGTVLSRVFFWRDRLPDVVMLYLLGILVVALRFGRGPSLAAAVLSVLVFDFLFVPPYFSFAVSDFQHIVTFAMMFVVAVVVSSLAERVREQAHAARAREQRTASLYAMSRELAATRTTKNLATVAVQHIHDVFEAKTAIVLARLDGRLESEAVGAFAFQPDEKESGVVDWVFRNAKPAGLGTDTLPASQALYLPLRQARGSVGVLGVMPADKNRFVDVDQRALLDVFAAQIASTLERARLAEEAQQATVQMEAERLRSSLLSSVSHDLRTPLSVITGAASALIETEAPLALEARRDLATTIHEEAQRLNRLVRNLLDMTKIASGAIKVAKEWQPLDAVIGAALGRVDDQLAGRQVDVRMPAEPPFVPIDAVLIEQVLINLLENAAKYTPPRSPIEVTVRVEDAAAAPTKGTSAASLLGSVVVIEVADRGPGIVADLADKIFEKFFRLPREGASGGAGLGLAICRGIVQAHGGRIYAENREGGGAVFRFTVPIEGTPPVIEQESP